MSWDPNTAIVVYQPIDFYALAAQEVSKSIHNIKIKLEKLEEELNSYEPPQSYAPLKTGGFNGRTVTVLISGMSGTKSAVNSTVTASILKKIENILSSVAELGQELFVVTQGFQNKYALEIAPLIGTICKLTGIANDWYNRHNDLYHIQRVYS